VEALVAVRALVRTRIGVDQQVRGERRRATERLVALTTPVHTAAGPRLPTAPVHHAAGPRPPTSSSRQIYAIFAPDACHHSRVYSLSRHICTRSFTTLPVAFIFDPPRSCNIRHQLHVKCRCHRVLSLSVISRPLLGGLHDLDRGFGPPNIVSTTSLLTTVITAHEQ